MDELGHLETPFFNDDFLAISNLCIQRNRTRLASLCGLQQFSCDFVQIGVMGSFWVFEELGSFKRSLKLNFVFFFNLFFIYIFWFWGFYLFIYFFWGGGGGGGT